MKLVLHSEETVNVYAVDGIPVVIEANEGLVPTVCGLWKVPDLVPSITIHSQVLNKVQGGAPLYLPGVTLPTGGVGFPMFQRGAIIAAHTNDNSAAGIVGRAAMSSADMLLRSVGVCLETLHVYGDQLCKDQKFSKIERPKLGSPSYTEGDITNTLVADVKQLSIQPIKDEWPSLGKSKASPSPVLNEPKIIPEVEQNEEQHDVQTDSVMDDNTAIDTSQTEETDIPSDMDGLLVWCLLTFLKLEGKNLELPLKTNLLYKNHLMPLCPPDRSLDVKKSSYKKMGKFLEAMQKEGLLEVRELEKGVDAITRVEMANPLLRQHRVPEGVGARVAEAREAAPHPEYVPPLVREMHCVTANVVDLFAPVKKGTALTAAEVRTTLTEYVKRRNLNSSQVKGAIALNPLLAKVVGGKEQDTVKWDVLMSSVISKMTPSTEMKFSDGSVKLTKAKLEPIKMQVATRSGNKKVTLVSNLESFGFSLSALSHACQVGVAASCGVTRSPGAKADQLMLQGDQTHFVAKLLIEKYGLPKKFVEGADKALNKKK
ncbi:hypothetical protein K1T71_011976 [Dendrolimus kikuchii]|uniref:Uncharacterized protein n=1 Tax=Dendrolimus kikuchii TaxID=765133 RepID=A0ACC1CMW5_9NEOP|nr:hypothetical protein K1T71_011976 [Dendrolimus kikuchii]